jgi:hypothetical protein
VSAFDAERHDSRSVFGVNSRSKYVNSLTAVISVRSLAAHEAVQDGLRDAGFNDDRVDGQGLSLIALGSWSASVSRLLIFGSARTSVFEMFG